MQDLARDISERIHGGYDAVQVALRKALTGIREDQELSRAEVARRAGLDVSTVWRAERDTDNSLNIRTFLRMCSALGVMPDEVMSEGVAGKDWLFEIEFKKRGPA